MKGYLLAREKVDLLETAAQNPHDRLLIGPLFLLGPGSPRHWPPMRSTWT
ncbi:MAG: hypothetical protein Q8P22_06840 [Chloroflexota bacterium]|nr:hypothetical protein [Chloroflexota bacterium]